MPFEYKQYYRRKLPHIHSPNATFFVTFWLFGAIPKPVIRDWQAKRDLLNEHLEKTGPTQEKRELLRTFNREWFAKMEAALDRAETGPTWLKDGRVAKLVYDSILHRSGKDYHLSCFCVMSNHVHVVFKPYVGEQALVESKETGRPTFESIHPTMPTIVQSLKGYTARKANQILGRTGQFWDSESYDHEIRSGDEFGRIYSYVVNNPVKAGIESDWRNYPWTWVSEGEDKPRGTG